MSSRLRVPAGDADARFAIPGAVDVVETLRLLRIGTHDPTFRFEAGRVWHATRTPEGPATLVVQAAKEPGMARARAWGPGAVWAVREAPRVLGVADQPETFDPGAGPERAAAKLRRLHERYPGLRVGFGTSVFETLVTVIYQQRVTWKDATFAHKELVKRYGERAPGPAALQLPPSAARFAGLGYADYHPAGVERKRAETIRRCAKQADRLEALRDAPLADARATLASLPGVGPWTVDMVAGLALGDADALPEGDYHLPNVIAWVMEGVARSDDARMLELLAPYAGHRWRVVRLLMAGNVAAPRFGPRLSRLPLGSARALKRPFSRRRTPRHGCRRRAARADGRRAPTAVRLRRDP